EFLNRVEAHVRALVARTSALRRGRDEFLLRIVLSHLVKDALFRCDNKLRRGVLGRVSADSTRRANEIGVAKYYLLTLRVREHRCFGVPRLQADELPLRERLVDDADTIPDDHVLPSRLLRQVAAEVPVRRKNDRLILRNLLDNVL